LEGRPARLQLRYQQNDDCLLLMRSATETTAEVYVLVPGMVVCRVFSDFQPREDRKMCRAAYYAQWRVSERGDISGGEFWGTMGGSAHGEEGAVRDGTDSIQRKERCRPPRGPGH